jgi:hypothetical protein
MDVQRPRVASARAILDTSRSAVRSFAVFAAQDDTLSTRENAGAVSA